MIEGKSTGSGPNFTPLFYLYTDPDFQALFQSARCPSHGP